MIITGKIARSIGRSPEINNSRDHYITKTCPFDTQRIFGYTNWHFHWKKKCDIFNIFAQNFDCRYTLEPPRRGGSNECPQAMFWIKNKKTPFFFIKVWFKRVYFHGHAFLMKMIHLHSKISDVVIVRLKIRRRCFWNMFKIVRRYRSYDYHGRDKCTVKV